MTLRSLLGLLVFVGLSSCAGGGVHVGALAPKPPTVMVASKLATPCYIVLDPARVKEQYEVERIGTIDEMQAFVTRDLKDLLSEHFATVAVVRSPSEIPGDTFVVADVKVDEFKKGSVSDGSSSYSVFDMTWSFALRTSDAKDYLFSFAGIAQSDYRAKSWNDVVSSMLEHALTGLLGAWAESDTFAKLQAWEESAAPGQ